MGKLHLMESWRDRAKGAMKDKGVSQDTLAEELGLTQGAIQKWLAGTRHPNLDDIDRIAAALNLPGYTLTHGVTAADTITDLPEPALSTLRRLIAAQRRGAASPALWQAITQVVNLALPAASADAPAIGAPIAPDFIPQLEQLSAEAEGNAQDAKQSTVQRRRTARP